jgi:hypothetical protein
MPGRSFNSTSYRYSINGQEKTDEISGNGNHTTARYWEYDTRLGRRWNLDPKPTIGISDYACFANNPIFITDPNGDEIKVKYGGFLGIGRKTATYQDGKWVDKKGNEVTSKNKFFNNIKNSVEKLNTKEEGKAIVKELSDTKNIFTIKPTSGFSDGAHKEKDPAGSQDPTKGSGGTIWVARRSDSQEPMFIVLGHEMGHGVAANRGRTNNATWFTIKQTGDDITKDEQAAMHYENLIRDEHKMPLREFYVPETQQGPRSETQALPK